MVATAECAGSFKGKDVGGLFYHAELGGISLRIGAKLAERFSSEESALGTGFDRLCCVANGTCNFSRTRVAALDHPQGDSLRASGTDAGHSLELGDEMLDGRRIIDALHDCCDHSSCGMPWRSCSMRRM